MALSIGSLVAATKVIEVDFPGLDGFKVSLSYISREKLAELRKKATKTVFKQRQPIEELDGDLFLKLYAEAIIKGWKGLTLGKLSELMVINDFPATEKDTVVDYSAENALELLKNSTSFDAFVGETIADLTNFQSPSTPNVTKA
jgi:hypothetical protein